MSKITFIGGGEADHITPDWQNATDADAAIRQISFRTMNGVMPASIEWRLPEVCNLYFNCQNPGPKYLKDFEIAVRDATDQSGRNQGWTVHIMTFAAKPR